MGKSYKRITQVYKTTNLFSSWEVGCSESLQGAQPLASLLLETTLSALRHFVITPRKWRQGISPLRADHSHSPFNNNTGINGVSKTELICDTQRVIHAFTLIEVYRGTVLYFYCLNWIVQCVLICQTPLLMSSVCRVTLRTKTQWSSSLRTVPTPTTVTRLVHCTQQPVICLIERMFLHSICWDSSDLATGWLLAFSQAIPAATQFPNGKGTLRIWLLDCF